MGSGCGTARTADRLATLRAPATTGEVALMAVLNIVEDDGWMKGN
jgi:hypothetical protein